MCRTDNPPGIHISISVHPGIIRDRQAAEAQAVLTGYNYLSSPPIHAAGPWASTIDPSHDISQDKKGKYQRWSGRERKGHAVLVKPA